MKRTIKRKKLSYTIVGLVLLAVIVVVLEATNTTHLFHKASKVVVLSKPITQLSPKPAPAKNPSTPTTAVNQGAATDKNGQVPSGISSDPSQWAVSTSGDLTLKAPLANGTFKSGDTVTGTASAAAGPVHYRLLDNQAGVIAQGTISVVNGNFTASLSFTPYASGGRLDVFNVDSNAKEINEVQVALNF